MHYTTLDSIPLLYQLDDNSNIYPKFFKLIKYIKLIELINFWLSELQHMDLHWVFAVTCGIFKLGLECTGVSLVAQW